MGATGVWGGSSKAERGWPGSVRDCWEEGPRELALEGRAALNAGPAGARALQSEGSWAPARLGAGGEQGRSATRVLRAVSFFCCFTR